jgi:hypothetical protein
MVIYEVNLTISNEIFEAYYAWLVEHIGIMLKFKGFRQAELAKEKLAESETTKITVRYSLNSEEDLSDYLTNHAPAMREDGIKKFGDKFSASRRIFTDLQRITSL